MFNFKKLGRYFLAVLLGSFLVSSFALAQPTRPGGISPTTPGALCLHDADTWILCESTFTFGDTSARIAEIQATKIDTITLVLGGAVTGNVHVNDDSYFTAGNTFAAPDIRMGWNTTQTVDAWYFGTADAQNVFLIAENGDRAFDFAHGAQTTPTVYIHSATQNTTQWISFMHNATNGTIGTGAGGLNLAPATITRVLSPLSIASGASLAADTSMLAITQPASTQSAAFPFLSTTAGTITLQGGPALATYRRYSFDNGSLSTDGSATSIADAATFYVDAAQVNNDALNLTITRNYAGWIDAGDFRLDGSLLLGATTNETNAGTFTQIQAASGGTVSPAYTLTAGAHTALTASTESSDVNFNLARTVQFATGALSLQRAFRIQNPTYAFVAASTLSTAFTVSLDGGPLAGANATITETGALGINTWLSNTVSTYGIMILQPGIANGTGATTNHYGFVAGSSGNVSLGNQTATTTNLASIRLDAITYESTNLVRTVTNPATLFIAGAPDGNNIIFTNGPYSLWVNAGESRFGGNLEFGTGVAITAGDYMIGRDADAANQLHLNVPTGATFELSVNDVAEMTLSATAVNFQNNSITTTGGGSLTGTWSDLGNVTTIDINGGTLDGVIIGGSSAAAATVTTLSMNNLITWSAGAVITAGSYQIGRDADGTNQLHLNVPTGASFEWSVNDVAEVTLNATRLAVEGGNLGVGTTTANSQITGWSTGTTTAVLDSSSTTQGSCIGLQPIDGSAPVYIFINASWAIGTTTAANCGL